VTVTARRCIPVVACFIHSHMRGGLPRRLTLEQLTVSTIDHGMELHRPRLLGIISVSQVGLALALVALSLMSDVIQSREVPFYHYYAASLRDGAESGESQSRSRPGFTASDFANIVLGNARENHRHTDMLALLSAVMLSASVAQLLLVQRLIKAAALTPTSASATGPAT